MYIAECLKHEGVERVFGQCGHTNYALIDSCHRHGIEYVSFRHEQMAGHAADAYYRVSHKLAVLNVHLSPGLTNAVTGIATAAADCTPMIIFAGNTQSYHHAREPHQGIRFHADASQGDLLRPVCKRVWRVDDPNLLPDVLPRALNVAQTGRPGAVLIDVPMDVYLRPVDAPISKTRNRRPQYGRPTGDPKALAAAAKALAKARRPIIFVGNGVLLSEATEVLLELAEATGIPVATTLMGKGAFPEDHPLALGTTGIWGSRVANDCARNADVILAVGTGFAEADCSSWDPRFTFSIPPSRLIQIDIDPQEIGKLYPVDIGIVGDAQASLTVLLRAMRTEQLIAWRDTDKPIDVAAEKVRWQIELNDMQQDDGLPIHPARLLATLQQTLPREAIVVTDVGWNKNGAGQQLRTLRPRSFITSGGFATMGFAPAAAVGAKLAAPDRKVVCLVGDGGLMSVVGALATAVELNVGVLWVLFNNFCFSTIRTVGTTYFKSAYGTEFRTPDGEPYNPDFQLMAKSFGMGSSLVEEPHELKAAIESALAEEQPYLLEVRTRGDVPMPRTGYWDIADFLRLGND